MRPAEVQARNRHSVALESRTNAAQIAYDALCAPLRGSEGYRRARTHPTPPKRLRSALRRPFFGCASGDLAGGIGSEPYDM